VRHVAKTSRINEYPQETTRDLEHVKLLADRFESYLTELRASRSAAESQADTDTVDLYTGVITEFEKNAWFLRASLESKSLSGASCVDSSRVDQRSPFEYSARHRSAHRGAPFVD